MAYPTTISDDKIPNSSNLEYLLQYSKLGMKSEGPKKIHKVSQSVKDKQKIALDKIRQQGQDRKNAAEKKSPNSTANSEDVKGNISVPQTTHPPGTSPDSTSTPIPPPGTSPKKGGGFAVIDLAKDTRKDNILALLDNITVKNNLFVLQNVPKGEFINLKIEGYKSASINAYYSKKQSKQFYDEKYEPTFSGIFLYDNTKITQENNGLGLSIKHYLEVLELSNKFVLRTPGEKKIKDLNGKEISGYYAIGTLFKIDGNIILVINVSFPNIDSKNIKITMDSLIDLFKEKLKVDSKTIKTLIFANIADSKHSLSIDNLVTMYVPDTNNIVLYTKDASWKPSIIYQSTIGKNNKFIIDFK